MTGFRYHMSVRVCVYLEYTELRYLHSNSIHSNSFIEKAVICEHNLSSTLLPFVWHIHNIYLPSFMLCMPNWEAFPIWNFVNGNENVRRR